MRVLIVLFVLLASSVFALAQASTPRPRVVAISRMPQYPPIAHAARIQGDVVLNVALADGGSVRGAEVVSGHPMFRNEAQQIADGLKFATGTDGQIVQVRLHFKLTTSATDAPAVQVCFSSSGDITVTTDPMPIGTMVMQ